MPNLDNPLRRHFRQPVIHLRLPSQGKFYPAGTLNLPPNGELPVLPMTAVDEIVTRTPDALFNGSAVPDIISSCIPAIRDPWSMPATDLNAVFIAMRLASYGHNMDINSICPKCNHQNEFEMDLRIAMDNLKTPDYDTPLVVGDLTFYFVPLTYRQINQNSQAQFEDQKVLQVMLNSDMPDQDRLKLLGDSLKKITTLTIQTISLSIRCIQTSDALVTEPSHILEFLNNCDKDMFNAVKDHAVNLRTQSDIKPMDATCSECSHQYTQELSLDISNFFATNS